MIVEKDIVVINKLGLHARAAAKLVKVSAGFDSSIELQKGGDSVDAKSIMGVLMLAAAQGSELKLVTNGGDAEEAANQIAGLFNNCFGEGE
jgi:phosphocarrier protein